METLTQEKDRSVQPRNSGYWKTASSVGVGLILGALAGIFIGLVAGAGIAIIAGVL